MHAVIDGKHTDLMAQFQKTLLQMQKILHIFFLQKPSYRQFCPKFRCHGNGGRSGKIQFMHSIACRPPYRRKNFADIFLQKPSYGHFCPKFSCHGNGGRSGKKCN